MLLFIDLDHVINLRLHHSAKGAIENSLRQVGNMFRYPFTQEEGGKIVREVVAIMSPEIISLLQYQQAATLKLPDR